MFDLRSRIPMRHLCELESETMSLENFQRESNRIEGIAVVLDGQVAALRHIVEAQTLTVACVEAYVSACQPGAVLRRAIGLNVRVGDHIAPPGGPGIETSLTQILSSLTGKSAWEAHVTYETLHPFTDGNGRSGRAVWLWRMLRGTDWERQAALRLGFLHTFYYQTLQATQREP
jgi:hypothetical protein